MTIGEQGASGASGVFTTATGTSIGNGGDIHIGAGNVALTTQGTVAASSYGTGDAGSITITAPGSFSSTGGIVGIAAQQGQGAISR